jgi:hypothetical protein
MLETPVFSTSQKSADQGQSYFVPSPVVSLPKGGGAIKGMGEKFAANPVTGTGNLTVPIATSPGRSGFGPQLSLSYDSGMGNGFFGMGWNLSLPSITRKTDKGLPRYQDGEESDVFLFFNRVILLKLNGMATVFVNTAPALRVYLLGSNVGASWIREKYTGDRFPRIM